MIEIVYENCVLNDKKGRSSKAYGINEDFGEIDKVSRRVENITSEVSRKMLRIL